MSWYLLSQVTIELGCRDILSYYKPPTNANLLETSKIVPEKIYEGLIISSHPGNALMHIR